MSSLPDQNELEFKRKNLPDKPGVYLYKDQKGEIIYIGKAKSLKKRVNSYWAERNAGENPFYYDKIRRLVPQIRDIDVFVVENEKEAIILENELIKTHQPPFNAMLRDDKSYPWVRITNDSYPRISVIRGPERFGLQHKYIGPFIDGYDLKSFLRFIRKIFPYCSCKTCTDQEKRTRPCIYYQINLCPAPCQGKISQEAYYDNIQNIEHMLLGNIDFVENLLKKKMEEASKSLAFEEAGHWRDRLRTLRSFTVKQSILSYDLEGTAESAISIPTEQELSNVKEKEKSTFPYRPKWKDMDVVAGAFSERRAGILLLHVRRGKIIGKTPYSIDISNKLLTVEDFFATLVTQHYLRSDIPLPIEIILETPLTEDTIQVLQQHFITQSKSIFFRTPQEEDKTSGLMRIAKKNIELIVSQKDEYAQYLDEQRLSLEEITQIQAGLTDLQKILELEEIPLIIEGFDMAHLQGTAYAGSMVTFVEGKPSKSHYRRYRVKTVDKPDDVAAMQEVLQRRYKRAIEEKNFPDLVVIDGGKPQLNVAHRVFLELGIENIPHIGLVKPEGRSEIYTPPKILTLNRPDPIELTSNSPGLHIIQQLRDESHRFANAYHQKLREKQARKSELDDIPGIGPARKEKLIHYFGSVSAIKAATLSQLTKLVGEKLAQTIYTYLSSSSSSTEGKMLTSSQSNAEKLPSLTKKYVLKKKKITHAQN